MALVEQEVVVVHRHDIGPQAANPREALSTRMKKSAIEKQAKADRHAMVEAMPCVEWRV